MITERRFNMPGKKYSEQHRVVYYDTDLTGRLNVGKLGDILMLVSNDQSNDLGVSLQNMKKAGLGWVVTQHVLTVDRMPRVGEELTITTQATSYNRYFCYRDFFVQDQSGKQVAKMHSVFVMMDLKQRKMVRLVDEFINPYSADYTTKIERLPQPQMQGEVTEHNERTYRVRYTDIDINRHVNNIHYIDWMVDALDKDFLSQHDLVSLNIVYKKEVAYGDTIHSQVAKNGLVTYHEIINDDAISCVAECHWQPVKED